MPTLTVAIPVFNAMPYLPETVESVLWQSCGDFELLIIDDGSTDGSLEYVNSLRDPRIRLVSQNHRGLTATLNRSLAEARTPWLVRLDADDIAGPNRLAHVADSVRAEPNAGMFYSRAKHHQHSGGISLVRSTEGTPAALRAQTRRGYLLSICHSTVVLNVRKTLDLGGYRFNLHVEDLDLWWRMALAHDIIFIPEITVAYRLNNASVCIRNLQELACNTLFAQYLLLSRLWNRLPLAYPEVRPMLETLVSPRRLRYRERMWNAAIHLSHRRYGQAAKQLLIAAANAPERFLARCSYPLWHQRMIRVGESPAVFHEGSAELWPSAAPASLALSHPGTGT